DQTARETLQRARQRLGRHLALVAGHADQLGAAGEELRRAAFVVVNVRLLVAERRLPGPRQRRQRQRVRRRAGWHEKGLDVGLENLGQLRDGAQRPRIGAVSGGRPAARRHHRCENFRRGAGRVVAGEIQGGSPFWPASCRAGGAMTSPLGPPKPFEAKKCPPATGRRLVYGDGFWHICSDRTALLTHWGGDCAGTARLCGALMLKTTPDAKRRA